MIFLRGLSILVDVGLSFFLFYQSQALKSISKLFFFWLFLVLVLHLGLTYVFTETDWFLGVNLLLNLVESYLVALSLHYRASEVSFWILCQTFLSLLVGAIFNQILTGFLPLSSLVLHSAYLFTYVCTSWFLSLLVTMGLRFLFQKNRIFFDRSHLEFSRVARYYLFVVPSLAIFFSFLVLAIQGQVFSATYLPVISLISLFVLGVSSLSFTLHFLRQQRQFYSSQLESEQLAFQIREMKSHKKDYEQLQRLRHDLRNSQLTLLSLLNEDPNKAKAYLLSLTSAIQEEETCYTKNSTINFLLNQKLQVVKQEVAVDIHCFVPENLGIAPELIAVILGNLLDNSIAASLRLLNQNERFLSLDLRYYQKTLFLAIENAFDEKEIQTRAHRKQEGWGLKNIDRLIKSHQGSVTRVVKDGHFKTEVILPLSDF